jgi:subtilisin-like proprotein convertase family protein
MVSNITPITINDVGLNPTAATPYPSTIVVAGLGNITDVNVTISGFTHTFPDDVDMLLVGPGGQQATIWSDVGGGTDALNITVTMDDAAASVLPTAGPLVSGTFQPTNDATSGADAAFPAPAPAATGTSALSVFNGTSPNGTWSLYIVDDADGDAGSIAGGWSLTFETAALAATFRSAEARRTSSGVVVRWRTASEVDVLGFRVYRVVAGKRVRVSRALIAAKGEVSGAAYRFVDRRAPRRTAGLRYRIQAVDRDGSVSWLGPPLRVRR